MNFPFLFFQAIFKSLCEALETTKRLLFVLPLFAPSAVVSNILGLSYPLSQNSINSRTTVLDPV